MEFLWCKSWWKFHFLSGLWRTRHKIIFFQEKESFLLLWVVKVFAITFMHLRSSAVVIKRCWLAVETGVEWTAKRWSSSRRHKFCAIWKEESRRKRFWESERLRHQSILVENPLVKWVFGLQHSLVFGYYPLGDLFI